MKNSMLIKRWVPGIAWGSVTFTIAGKPASLQYEAKVLSPDHIQVEFCDCTPGSLERVSDAVGAQISRMISATLRRILPEEFLQPVKS